MSSLTDLPEEILIIIIKQLDIKSVYNLYRTCGILKNIICMQGVIKKCNLSCNTLSIPRSLQLDMIKNISRHLCELNMCGVSNLRKSILLPAIARMKCLKTLDVSYTEINVFDMLDLYLNCSTIKNITINLPDLFTLTDKSLLEFQEVFKNFINVHFITRLKILNLPVQILKKSTLDTLKFTINGVGGSPLEVDELANLYSYKHICIFMVNYGPANSAYQGFWTELLPIVKTEIMEYIIIDYNGTYSICTTPMFKKFFSDNFKITSFASFDANRRMCNTVAIFIWNNKNTSFDETFFSHLKKRIKEILACELISSEQTLPLGIDTHCYDWFHLHSIEAVVHRNRRTDTELDFKKRRIVQSNHVLDYDNLFSEHKTIKLHIYISHSVNITLSSSTNFLRKLTYLSLAGSFVRYSNEFFNILFRCCKKLITLNVEASSLSPCGPSVMRSVPLSQSLKNIRLIDKRVDFGTLFYSFSQCKTLENVCVIDSSCDVNELADFAALYQCANLYSLHIQAEVRKSTLTKMNALHKNLLKRHPEHYINFTLQCRCAVRHEDYNPYLNVFNLTPLKPV